MPELASLPVLSRVVRLPRHPPALAAPPPRYRMLMMNHRGVGHAGKRVMDAMKKLETDHAKAVDALQARNGAAVAKLAFTFGNRRRRRVTQRVVVTVDVEELKCPIELEVGSFLVVVALAVRACARVRVLAATRETCR